MSFNNTDFENCSCGKVHTCQIDVVKIGNSAINDLATLCENYKNILLVSDQNTYKVCGERVFNLLKNKINKNLILNSNTDVLIPNEQSIKKIENEINENTDLIIGVGSGVINDLCKYVSFFNNLSYFIVATAPSMDGYASVGAAMILNGMKTTVNTAPPKAIIADTEILKNAPIDMLKAGYGDIIGKFSCLNDWKLSALINQEYFCQKVYDCTYNSILSIKDNAKEILAREEDAISNLMQALVTVGILMSYVGSSRPASGSEHHLSHFFEITGILESKEYFAHGIDVIYSTYYTQKIREELLKLDEPIAKHTISEQEYKQKIRQIYHSLSDEVLNLQEKLGWYNIDKLNIYKENWAKIKEILAEVPNCNQIEEYINNIGLSLDDFVKLYGTEKINNALYFAKDLKDRYSVLWLNFELNYKG